MRPFFSKLNHAFAAGCFGALVNSLVVWLSGLYHLTSLLGVTLTPSLSLPWLYQRIVWGGIWGFLFLLAPSGGSAFRKGLILSLIPTVIQLFLIFPNTGKGMLGKELGTLTPLFVLVFNACWGVAAAIWMKMARG